MIARLLLSTLVGLSAGTAAFTVVTAETELGKAPTMQIEKAQIEKPAADQPRPLNRVEKWQADRQAEQDAVKTPTKMPASHASPNIQGQALASHASAAPSVTLSEGVSVSESDRNRMTEAVARMTVKPLRGVDFSVTVGSQVPRELRLYSLPAEVIEIVPQYRDKRFLVVDKEILIVEPLSQKIVAIMPRDAAVTTVATTATPPATSPVTTTAATAVPASAPSPASAAGAQASTPDKSAKLEQIKVKKQAAMARAERRTARRETREWQHARAEVRVGQRVPDNVVLQDLPPPYRGDARASRARISIQID